MLVSVVMPVYNGEAFLMESVDSVLNQTYKHFELIVVNDGSTDRTKDILSSLNDDRIKSIHLEKNGGAANALNIGIKEAKGDWIAIQDADDISLPNKLEEQIRYICEHPDATAVGSLIECISGHAEVPMRNLQIEATRNHLSSKEHIHAYRFYLNPFCHGSVLFSKSIFNQIGGYDPQYKICYDYDLWLRMLELNPIHKIPIVLYQYRVHSGSISRKNQQTINEDWLVASKHLKKQLQERFKRAPSFIVFGKEEACEDFKQVSLMNRIDVSGYFYKDFENDGMLQLYYERNIDGIIFLEDISLISLFYKLQEKGLELNKNLYKIWAGYYK
ncbi:glycosyltransferase [Fictibacillus sp. WQ 8-8]|uniref:glycosyltransferase family 2 protein n=1 Tax=Fictibacillus sp. WQ 8-8 TaxID=2938788 RepID=UPI002108C709|nr:glycosyltransferase [Fictibacillus sp. WQ 8-8]MCQ6265561.1 glycosyltransferase [Fictibacillus sp. WQ 8-8]